MRKIVLVALVLSMGWIVAPTGGTAAAEFSNASLSGSWACVGAGYASTKSNSGPGSWLPTASIMQVVSDGHGKFTAGSTTVNAVGNTCSWTLSSGSYSIKADGTGTSTLTWKAEPSNTAKCPANAIGTTKFVMQNAESGSGIGTSTDTTEWLVCNKQTAK